MHVWLESRLSLFLYSFLSVVLFESDIIGNFTLVAEDGYG